MLLQLLFLLLLIENSSQVDLSPSLHACVHGEKAFKIDRNDSSSVVIADIASDTALMVICIDVSNTKVEQARRRIDTSVLYGVRPHLPHLC